MPHERDVLDGARDRLEGSAVEGGPGARRDLFGGAWDAALEREQCGHVDRTEDRLEREERRAGRAGCAWLRERSPLARVGALRGRVARLRADGAPACSSKEQGQKGSRGEAHALCPSRTTRASA